MKKMKKMKIGRKAFTLIELLAVVIILGILLLIAVPAVSKYIEDSRMKTYKNNLIRYIDAVRVEVNLYDDNDYKFFSDEYLVVPLSCIQLEKGNSNKSPFSQYIQDRSFVLVIRNNDKYEYYVSALDSSGYGTEIADEKKIKIEKLDVDSVGVITATKVDLGNEKNVALGLHNKDAKITTCSALGELDDPRLAAKIMKDNQVLDSSNLNYMESSSDTAGLYSININTQDNKDTYFFRGNVQNNYVAFGSKDGKCVYYNPDSGVYQDVYYKDFSTPVSNEAACLSTNVYINDFMTEKPMVGYDNVDICTTEIEQNEGLEGSGNSCRDTYENATWSTGNLIWRIVRINEDGSVRLILDNTIGYGETFDVDADTSPDDVVPIPSNAPIVTTLTNWYNNNLSKYADSFANSGYCYYNAMYDNGLPGSIDRFDNYDRLFQGTLSPQFKCLNRINNANGFGAQVGLITADEAVYAGVCKSGSDTCPSYLYDNLHYMEGNMVLTSGFLTMTPVDRGWDVTNKISFAGVGMDGLTIVKQSEVSEPMSISGIRPVINLRADLEVLSGNGTVGSPYLIKTN